MSKVPEFEKVKCESPDLAKQNLEKLKQLFPGVVTEGPDGVAIDVEALKQECSAKPIEGNVERYEFTWPGKRAAKAAASTATNKTLRPCRAESVNFDTTENLYIEGDNLEVLKLLQTNYAGKVKMIYIDPPYNTGKDFIYRDSFSLTQEELENTSGAIDDEGDRFEINDQYEARYHSNWCSMIYPRLKLARNLLDCDGLIFVAIDENEIVNMRRILDEIFGENNLLSVHHIQVRYGQKSLNEKKDFQELLEYVLIYAKDKSCAVFNKPTEQYPLEKFNLKVIHDDTPSKVVEENGRKVDVWLPGTWRVEQVSPSIEGFKETWISGSILTGTGHGTMYLKCVDKRRDEDGNGCLYRVYGVGEDGLGYRYYTNPKNAVAGRGKMLTKIPLDKKEMILSGDAVKENPIINFYDFSADFGNIRNEGGIPFNAGKKPIKMLKQFMDYFKTKDVLVLDFFSGSASTAHAVMQLNAEDGGNRKFIMVQLPEPCAEDSEAAKAGYKNICEIGKERIRRAGKKIAEENATTAPNIDIGFRVLKLDSSSLEDASETASGTQQQTLGLSSIKEDRTSEDLLFQILLESKLSLSDKIEKKKVEGNEVFFVSDTALVACLDAKAKMTEKFFTALAKFQPALAFFRDDLFESDSARINLAQIFKQFSPDTTITVI